MKLRNPSMFTIYIYTIYTYIRYIHIYDIYIYTDIFIITCVLYYNESLLLPSHSFNDSLLPLSPVLLLSPPYSTSPSTFPLSLPPLPIKGGMTPLLLHHVPSSHSPPSPPPLLSTPPLSLALPHHLPAPLPLAAVSS